MAMWSEGGGGGEGESNGEQVPLIPGLPDDLAIRCLARASRGLHPLLRRVCRGWRRLLLSPPFFELRASLGLAQSWLYVMCRGGCGGRYRWCALDDDTRAWVPIPEVPRFAIGAACAAAAGRLFVIGGSSGETACRHVWAYDPRYHKWEEVAPMKVPREFATAGVVGERVYVLGGCTPASWACNVSWAEVYDPFSNKWSIVPSPAEHGSKWMQGNAVLEGRVLAIGERGGVIFDPSSSSWEPISPSLDSGWKGQAAVVKNILFSCNCLGKILGYDLKKDKWLEVEGWQKDLPTIKSVATLTNVGERLYVLGALPHAGWDAQVVLAVFDIHKETNCLKAQLLWWQIISCDKVVGTIVQSLALAL